MRSDTKHFPLGDIPISRLWIQRRANLQRKLHVRISYVTQNARLFLLHRKYKPICEWRHFWVWNQNYNENRMRTPKYHWYSIITTISSNLYSAKASPYSRSPFPLNSAPKSKRPWQSSSKHSIYTNSFSKFLQKPMMSTTYNNYIPYYNTTMSPLLAPGNLVLCSCNSTHGLLERQLYSNPKLEHNAINLYPWQFSLTNLWTSWDFDGLGSHPSASQEHPFLMHLWCLVLY